MALDLLFLRAERSYIPAGPNAYTQTARAQEEKSCYRLDCRFELPGFKIKQKKFFKHKTDNN